MRWVKLSAFLSLWALVFALVAVTHLRIGVLGLPNRRQIISRLTRSLTLLLRSILNIKVTVVGNDGQSKIECCRYEDDSAGRKKLAKDCSNRVLGGRVGMASAQDYRSESRADDWDAGLSS